MLGSSLSYGDSNYSTDQIHSIFRSVSRLFVFKNEAKMFLEKVVVLYQLVLLHILTKKKLKLKKLFRIFKSKDMALFNMLSLFHISCKL